MAWNGTWVCFNCKKLFETKLIFNGVYGDFVVHAELTNKRPPNRIFFLGNLQPMERPFLVTNYLSLGVFPHPRKTLEYKMGHDFASHYRTLIGNR